jgi:hypothetical protein
MDFIITDETQNRLLQRTIRLWVVCRFIEGQWKSWGDEVINEKNPKSPFDDWKPIPPYVDYQIASIFIQLVLVPLRKEVLNELQEMMNAHRPQDWYVTFLVSYILLQNYELQMQFQNAYARRRSAKIRYMDMELVRAINSGAKTILAHFHYCCKGQQPFKREFDWTAPKTKRMAKLDDEESEFMAHYRDLVSAKAEVFDRVNHSDRYHQKSWYTSQLFDPNWSPRETLEHSPDADPAA